MGQSTIHNTIPHTPIPIPIHLPLLNTMSPSLPLHGQRTLESSGAMKLPAWCNDQPGRFLALCVFGPLLLWRGMIHEDLFVIGFGALLIIWDAFWILTAAPRQAQD